MLFLKKKNTKFVWQTKINSLLFKKLKMIWTWIINKQIIQGIGFVICNNGRHKYEINLSLHRLQKKLSRSYTLFF